MSARHEFAIEHSGPYVRVVCDDCDWKSPHWRYATGLMVQRLLHGDENVHYYALLRAEEAQQ